MALEEPVRKLTAIMLADVAGFSSLMERDEAETFSRVRNLREVIVTPFIAVHGGRIIKTTGDGFLAEFASATAALKCAIAIQRANHEAELAQSEQKRLHMRIGLNVGDILIDGEDVAGDGVNIAARLEPQAPLDGICLSAALRDQVREELGVPYEDMGELLVKNISRPIRAYRINLANVPVEKIEVRMPTLSKAWVRVWTFGVVAVIVALFACGWLYLNKKPLPPQMSMVVLPFVNTSGDPGQEYVSDALTDDITVQMSKIKGSFVIGRATAFTFKGKPVDLKAIAKELNVRYVLQGTAAKSGDVLHVTVQLIDGTTAADLWADTFDADIGNISEIRRRVVSGLAVALKFQLITAEARRVDANANPTAADLTMKGWEALYLGGDKNSLLAAKPFFVNALALQSNYEPALAELARIESLLGAIFTDPNRMSHMQQAEKVAATAISIEPSDPMPHFVMARVRYSEGRLDEAIVENSKALELNPNYVDAITYQTLLHIVNGQSESAVGYAERALDLSPLDPGRYLPLSFECHALVHLKRFREALPLCEKSASMVPYWGSLSDLVAIYAALGDQERSAEAVKRLMNIAPQFSITWYKNLKLSTNTVWSKEIEEAIFVNLRKAGIPN